MLGAIGLDAMRGTVPRDQGAERLAGPGAVEVVTGARAVAQRLARMRLGAGEEVCALLTGRPWGAPAEESGVPHRTVVERAALAGARGRDGATAALGRVEPARLRAVERVPAELVIADRRIALLPLASHTAESAALVVHGGALLESLVDLFEDVWHEALPIRAADADPARAGHLPGARIPGGPGAPGPDAVDLEVLSLLLVGLTDASVAKQLGLGLRTVQRRVKRLMELAGVTTRLQLGWHAAEHGWTARG
ncbi:hypothetical protein SNS2_5622 [Streptomyces netropsis]|nr:hypothetical protein SNS2_5622 [Streptomyces netropsis]